MAQELLKVEHLSAAYGGIHALYDISLKVDEGETEQASRRCSNAFPVKRRQQAGRLHLTGNRFRQSRIRS